MKFKQLLMVTFVLLFIITNLQSASLELSSLSPANGTAKANSMPQETAESKQNARSAELKQPQKTTAKKTQPARNKSRIILPRFNPFHPSLR